jgi:hypothetical protein
VNRAPVFHIEPLHLHRSPSRAVVFEKLSEVIVSPDDNHSLRRTQIHTKHVSVLIVKILKGAEQVLGFEEARVTQDG